LADGKGGDPSPIEPVVAGRRMLFFIQNDLGSSRNHGLIRMIHNGKKIVDGLTPGDWVAVMSFDSHLKMHLDFTRDHAAAKLAIDRCLTKVPGRTLDPGEAPSLAAYLDVEEARDAPDPETGLRLMAQAMDQIKGTKIMVYIGWGFGSLDETGVKQNSRYDSMIRAMHQANLSVFSLDLTMADYHSLETGLKQIASDTGGFYVRTANFPLVAIDKFLRAISGHYLITFACPPESTRRPEFRIDLRNHRGEVIFQKSYKTKGFH
jgi:hypothetical protein